MAARPAEETERFAERHRLAGLDAMKATELESTGSDYGASGYTTMEQVGELARRLPLGPEDLLLDLGSGTGWPGLHVAKVTGCSVVVTDPVGEGPEAARTRARGDHIDDRASAVPADGRALPFRSWSFDALVHSDALC
jgi:ubiquinone/menaquinone biosynthesis C-methylase UbiE